MKVVKLAYKPHIKQKEIHESCSKDSIYKYITVIAGRQSGKSKAAQMQTIKWALENRNIKLWVISPSASQSQKFYKTIKNPLLSSGLVVRHLDTKGNLLLELINGSVIEFKSGLSKDNLRGDTLDYLIIDEGSFVDEDVIEEILRPMLVTKPNSKMLTVTTPKGKNWVHRYAMTNRDEYIYIHFTSKDNPLADQQYLEELKQTMNEKLYKQEILAEFVDSATVFEYIYDICLLQPSTKKQDVYVGIDIGMVDDYTVITVLDTNGNQLLCDRTNNTDTNSIIDRITDVYKTYNVVKGAIELNNQGRPIYDLLRTKGINITGFNTTNESKDRIINQLITAFKTKSIKLLNDDVLIKELESFIFEFLPSGKIRYKAANGSHDDTVMSLAICYNLFNELKTSNIISVY